jgi:hypothetical protein
VVAAGVISVVSDFLNPPARPTVRKVFTVPSDKVPRPGGQPYYEQAGRFCSST